MTYINDNATEPAAYKPAKIPTNIITPIKINNQINKLKFLFFCLIDNLKTYLKFASEKKRYFFHFFFSQS